MDADCRQRLGIFSLALDLKFKLCLLTFISSKRISTICPNTNTSRWTKFELRPNQMMAPLTYRQITESESAEFEKNLASQENSETILSELKSRQKRTRAGQRPKRRKDDDCLLINPELERALKNVSKLYIRLSRSRK